MWRDEKYNFPSPPCNGSQNGDDFPPQPSVPLSFCPSPTDLVRVGDVGAAVTGVSHAVSVPVQLVSVLDTLAIVQKVLQAFAHQSTRDLSVISRTPSQQ